MCSKPGALAVNAPAEEAFALVERKDLAAGESTLGSVKANEGGARDGGIGDELQPDSWVAVADPALEGTGGGQRV